MAGTSTVYDVNLRYRMPDGGAGAAGGLGKIGRAADRAGSSTGLLTRALGVLGAGVGIRAIKSSLIDFNSEMEQMKLGMATVINMQLKKPFEEARKEADKLFFRFQDLAKQSPATTKDYMQFASIVSPTIASMGGGIQEIEKIVGGGVIAGLTLGAGQGADVSARDIQSLLNGTVHVVDKMAIQLLASRGIDKEAWNKKTGQERGRGVIEMLQDPAIKSAAEAMGESFAGVTSTFKDNLQIALAKVGIPLMKVMSEEVKSWSTWIDNNQVKIEEISKSISDALVDAFKFIKTTVGWLVDNRDTIFMIGKIFLAFKAAGAAGNLLNGVVRSFQSFRDGLGTFREGLTAGSSKMGEFSKSLGTAVAGLGILYVAATAFAAWVDGRQESGINKISDTTTMRGLVDKENALKSLDRNNQSSRYLIAEAMERGIIKKDKYGAHGLSTSTQAARDAVYAMADATVGTEAGNVAFGLSGINMGNQNDDALLAKAQELESMLIKAMDRVDESVLADIARDHGLLPKMEKLTAPDFTGKGNRAEKGETNITINKIEVASDDPDRFVFGMVKAIQDIARNPTQPHSAIAGIH